MAGVFNSYTKKWHNEPYPAIDPTLPQLSASGKFVVVTGGGTGLGLRAAVAFARAGAKTVAILGRRVEKLQSAGVEIKSAAEAVQSPTQVIFESGDASKRADLDAAVAKLVKKAGGAKIDVLVAFASVSDQDGPIIGYSEEDLRRNFEINILGSFNTIQSVSPFLANNAQLFNISSGMLHIKPYGRHWLSASSKGLIAKMFDFLADEKPEMHIVSVQPGVVATDYNKRFGVTGMDHPDLNAHFCVWLASPEAAFLKGKFVWANWDKDELVAKADEIKNSLLFRTLLHGVEM